MGALFLGLLQDHNHAQRILRALQFRRSFLNDGVDSRQLPRCLGKLHFASEQIRFNHLATRLGLKNLFSGKHALQRSMLHASQGCRRKTQKFKPFLRDKHGSPGLNTPLW